MLYATVSGNAAFCTCSPKNPHTPQAEAHHFRTAPSAYLARTRTSSLCIRIDFSPEMKPRIAPYRVPLPSELLLSHSPGSALVVVSGNLRLGLMPLGITLFPALVVSSPSVFRCDLCEAHPLTLSRLSLGSDRGFSASSLADIPKLMGTRPSSRVRVMAWIALVLSIPLPSSLFIIHPQNCKCLCGRILPEPRG